MRALVSIGNNATFPIYPEDLTESGELTSHALMRLKNQMISYLSQLPYGSINVSVQAEVEPQFPWEHGIDDYLVS